MQIRPYSHLRKEVLDLGAEGSRECVRLPILDESFCVVVCVVTLASLG
jgi:hypothetical protein